MNVLSIPASCLISREEAYRRRREAKHHIVVKEGNVAIHMVFDPVSGVTTVVDHAVLEGRRVRR